MSTRRSLFLFLLLLIVPMTLAACGPRARGGGGAADDDDDDNGSDDDDAQGNEIPASLTHEFELEIGDVTEMGAMFGLAPCTAFINGSVARDDVQSPCAGCDAVWTGPITASGGTCSGMSVESDTFTYAFETLADGVGVWQWSTEDQVWNHEGDAVWQDGGILLEVEEPMGEGEFLMATTWLTYWFE